MSQNPTDSRIAAPPSVELDRADPFGTPIPGDPVSLVRYAWASEVHGQALFERLAAAAGDGAARDYWRLLARVEGATAACLEQLAMAHGIAPVDGPALRDLSATTAVNFRGRSPEAYFDWVGPQIDPYLIDLKALGDYFASSSERELVTLVIEHEEAIIRSWRLLSDGLEVASAPLRGYLALASRSGIG